MIKVYMFLIIMGILGAVGYGGYMYYKDTQQRIMNLKENNAKLEVAEQIANETINTMIADREKYTELNKELQGKLQKAETYGDQLRATLQKHDLTHFSTNGLLGFAATVFPYSCKSYGHKKNIDEENV